ncbi:PREDICTED: long-chain-fatty-acid--CoA ligase 1-like [Acropora digitifera]|uniref:long-chain-fatty-acid--CoA ligase 1-like n=1 Tax=Acropora digitifera TaxID=70779 RepID=UPI00077AC8C0|nr:PREDICTED: long-chain-fatty-acid--CoA ligase 1-like [Acropora digitifera]
MAQVSQSKVKRWLLHKALAAKEADLKRGIVKGNTIWDKVVFKKIQMSLGGRVRLISSGAAPLSSNVMLFLRCAFGECHVIEGYGQTETCASGCITFVTDQTAGHVGPPLACNAIKLVDVPQKECYAKNGKGEVRLGVNDFRRLLKVSSKSIETGEYIAPEKIENIYCRSPFVAQAFVHGDSLKSYVVGIIVPDQEVLESWALAKKIPRDFAQLCENEAVKKEIFDDIIRKGKEAELNSFEQVKAISLHKELFSVDNGFLTPTFKTKRPVVQKFFEKTLQELYAEVIQVIYFVMGTCVFLSKGRLLKQSFFTPHKCNGFKETDRSSQKGDNFGLGLED